MDRLTQEDYEDMAEEIENLEAEIFELHAQIEDLEEQLEQLEYLENQLDEVNADADLGFKYRTFVQWLTLNHPNDKEHFDKLYNEFSMANLKLS